MSQIIDLINPTGSLMHVNKEYYEKNPDKFVEFPEDPKAFFVYRTHTNTNNTK